MKYIYIFLTVIALGAIGYFFYNHTQEAKLPQLLPRKGDISIGSNWANTKKAIQGLQDKIRKNPKDYTSS